MKAIIAHESGVMLFRRMASLRNITAFVITLQTLSQVVAQGPLVLQTCIEEANEALFDGDYEKALRLTDHALAAINTPVQQKAYAHIGGDWTLTQGFIQGLQCEVLLNSGSYSQARAKLSAALHKIGARRTFYQRLGAPTVDWWLYSAYLMFLEGDLDYCPPSHGFFGESLNETNNRKAIKSYRRAADILERLLRLDPTPDKTAIQGPELHANRLMLRLAISMARVELSPELQVGADASYPLILLPRAIDAEAYIMRAKDLLNNNFVYKEFIRPKAEDDSWHLSYKDLQDYQDKKKNDNADGLTEQEILELKHLVFCAISDCITINNALAEVEAIKQICGDGQKSSTKQVYYSPQNAEIMYHSTAQFLRDQFRIDHPLLAATELSLMRWYAVLSTPGDNTEPLSSNELRRRVSYARDVLFHASKVRLQTASRRKLSWELDRLEARALANLDSLNSRVGFLSAEQKKELDARLFELERTFAASE